MLRIRTLFLRPNNTTSRNSVDKSSFKGDFEEQPYFLEGQDFRRNCLSIWSIEMRTKEKRKEEETNLTFTNDTGHFLDSWYTHQRTVAEITWTVVQLLLFGGVLGSRWRSDVNALVTHSCRNKDRRVLDSNSRLLVRIGSTVGLLLASFRARAAPQRNPIWGQIGK